MRINVNLILNRVIIITLSTLRVKYTTLLYDFMLEKNKINKLIQHFIFYY